MLTRDDLTTLLADTTTPAVSAFLPTHVAGREIAQDSTRLRNLLNEARGQLEQKGMRSTDAMNMLKPGYDLVDDGAYWRHQSHGLAVFLNPRRSIVHKVPIEVPEALFVDDRFHVRPLLPVLAADGHFVLLAVTMKQARLYEGSRFGLTEVPIERLPRGTENLFTVLDRMGESGTRPDDGTTQKPTTANASDTVAYAQSGSQQQVSNDELGQYTTQLAHAMDQWLGGSGTPLVVAADERVAGRYKMANRYPNLVQPVIQTHPDSMSEEELHKVAYECVRPMFEQGRSDSLDRYRMLAGDGSGRGIAEPAQIIEAAFSGRVDRLFLRQGAECWGRWLEDSNRAVIHHGRQDGDREMMEFAAGRVFTTDGRVYELPAEQMPADSPMAATLRY